jgi:hypothetical protein
VDEGKLGNPMVNANCAQQDNYLGTSAVGLTNADINVVDITAILSLIFDSSVTQEDMPLR